MILLLLDTLVFCLKVIIFLFSVAKTLDQDSTKEVSKESLSKRLIPQVFAVSTCFIRQKIHNSDSLKSNMMPKHKKSCQKGAY